MSAHSPLPAEELAEQARLREGLRAAGLPVKTSAGEDFDLAWQALENERTRELLPLAGPAARHRACAKAGLL